MMKDDLKKVSKLNDFDKHVLLQYSDFSLETGAKVTAEAAEAKAIHKDYKITV